MASNEGLTTSIVALILSCLCLGGPYSTCHAQTDTLKPGEVMGFYGRQLVSAGQNFTLGFFRPRNSYYIYLAIWFNDPAFRTPVWVANRNTPLEDSNISLKMDAADGKLKIMNSTGSLLLVLNSDSNQAARNSKATLIDSGNFVVTELNLNGSTKRVLWQSFDYPTDTLLPGMKLGMNFRTGQKQSLTSWVSENDAAPGTFSLEWNNSTSNGTGQLVMRRRGNIYWTSGILNTRNQTFPNIPLLELFGIYKLSYVTNANESFFTISLIIPSYLRLVSSWLVLTWEGTISLTTPGIDWNGGMMHKIVEGDLCYADPSYHGCAVQKLPKCRNSNERFERRQGVYSLGKGVTRWLDYNASIGLSDCLVSCWNDCSCVGYEANNSFGTGCTFWGNTSAFVPDLSGTTGSVVYLLNSTSPNDGNESKNERKWWIWIIIAVVAVVATLLFGILFYLRRRKLNGEKERNEEDLSLLLELTTLDDSEEIGIDGNMGRDVKLFSLASIMAATNNFSEENKLGQGGFGPVYKGKLPEGQEIAVKKLSIGSGQGLVEFKNEIVLIAKLQHMNLVRLWGCCIQGGEKMLIYEYMPNKSLDFFLFDPTNRELLDWKKRYNIIEGIAQGLLYLHKYSRLRIIHRDLKASNILLDANMNPKISDFGTARIFRRNDIEVNTNRVVGTRGYMSPEYVMEGTFSEKSDVYSFGVLMLEIVSGKKINSLFYHDDHPISLVQYAWELWKERKIMELKDSTLVDSSGPEISKCIHVALLCVQGTAVDRPTMSDIISILNNETKQLPTPKEPAFTTQQRVEEVGLHNSKFASCCTSLSTVVEAR